MPYHGAMRRLLLLVVLSACSPTNDPIPPDAGADATVDGGSRADVAPDPPDAAERVDSGAIDAGPDLEADAGGGACVGACRAIDLAVTLGGTTVAAERAFYGLTSPAMGASGEWELHVEAYRGGSAGCPGMDSPTPDQTVILTGIPLRPAPVTLTEGDGIAVSLLDFEGALTMDIATPASGEEVSLAAYTVCQNCTGDDPEGWLALDVRAPLEGGDITGHVFATHCASLDAR